MLDAGSGELQRSELLIARGDDACMYEPCRGGVLLPVFEIIHRIF